MQLNNEILKNINNDISNINKEFINQNEEVEKKILYKRESN
jgi:hypothetical protein